MMRNLLVYCFTYMILSSGMVFANGNPLKESCKISSNGFYFGGFVKLDKKDKDDLSENIKYVANADVLIYRRSDYELLYEIKTNSDGWYEIDQPLSNCNNQIVDVLVIARGYETKSESILVSYPFEDGQNKNYTARKDICLKSRGRKSFSGAYEPVTPKNVYGYVEDESGYPIYLSEITLQNNGLNKKINKTFTRESGFFNIAYDIDEFDTEVGVVVDHDLYDKGHIKLNMAGGYFVEKIIRREIQKSLWGFGLSGVYIISHDESRDKDKVLVEDHKEFYSGLVLNLMWFPSGVIIKDDRYLKTLGGSLGVDMSLTYSTEDLIIADGSSFGLESNTVSTFGVGVVKLIEDSDFILRAGISYSSEKETGIYIGISVPLFYAKRVLDCCQAD